MLPIDQIKDQIIAAVARPGFQVLIKAPTGSGKSTRVPQFLDEAGVSSQGAIVVVQPRRIAARLLSQYVARSMGETLGKGVGYVVRFDRNISNTTRIIFVTDGMLERWLVDNPSLEGIKAIIFDEFHERSLSSDLSLGRVLDLQRNLRPDLGIVIMSATIDLGEIGNSLGSDVTCFEAMGRAYPVSIEYLPPRQKKNIRGFHEVPTLWEQALYAVKHALQRGCSHDILIFMPGVYEIRKTCELLGSQALLKSWDIVELHGSLSPELQNRAITPSSVPKIIVSTNVAETSLTIEGVKTVIDSGVVRQSGWDPHRGMNTLKLEKISQASADQRTGRAGRICEGHSIRLWSESDHGSRHIYTLPELYRVDLSGALLTLHVWGYRQWQDFSWFNHPPASVLDQSERLLQTLGALDAQGQITPVGREMMNFPLPPRLSRLMVAGAENQCVLEMAAIAALLHNEHIAKKSDLDALWSSQSDYSDFQAEWRAVTSVQERSFDLAYCNNHGLLARAAREIWQTYLQLIRSRSNGELRTIPVPNFEDSKLQVIDSMLSALGDHVGVKNGIASNTCKLVGNKGGKIDKSFVTKHGVYFMAGEIAEVTGKSSETRIQRNTIIDLNDLQRNFADEITEQTEPCYDETKKRVLARRQIVWRGLTLLNQEKGEAQADQAAEILAQLVLDGVLKLHGWNHEVEQWILRVNLLHEYLPEMEFPAFTQEDALVAMTLVCEGAVGYKDIKDREILPILEEWLAPWQKDVLNREAPTSLVLENGQKAKVTYEENGSASISLQLQRLYGVKQTPRIAQNQLTLKVILLAPNQRPYQTTDSLERFWQSGYTQMKKDLAGRYPKHRWPDPQEIALMHKS